MSSLFNIIFTIVAVKWIYLKWIKSIKQFFTEYSTGTSTAKLYGAWLRGRY